MTPYKLETASAGYNGRAVLRDIRLQIKPGERVGLIGKSGAGKSTLINLAYNTWPGESTLIPQDLGLVASLSLFHNVYMGRLDQNSALYNLRNLVRPRRREIEQIQALIQPLGLSEQLYTRAGELSGGQRQRVAVARAIYRRSPPLLADEPVSSVDAKQARVVLDQLCYSFDTALIVMHDLGLARQYTDRLIGVAKGRILFDSRTDAVTDTDLAYLYQD